MKSLKILIAEAESMIRKELHAALTPLGHEVQCAADGREALDLFYNCAPDLAVLGIRRSRTDLLDAAREMQRHRPIPILVLTAAGEPHPPEQAASLPIQGHLATPVDGRVLESAIETAMSRFQESQILAREAAELRYDLECRKTVERAKGRLMKQGKSAEEAFREIQARARSEHISMRLAAAELLRAAGE